MKVLFVCLVLLLLSLQFRYWFGDGGLIEVDGLQQSVSAQKTENTRLKERNATLAAEVKDLKTGVAAIEERARKDLGMIKSGETFYLTIEAE